MQETLWNNYFNTLEESIRKLRKVVADPSIDPHDFMRDASIKRFEFTIILFSKMLKKILQYEKIETTTLRDTLSKAYQYKLIDSEEIWLGILDDSDNISNAYKEEQAKVIFENIKGYLPVFETTYNALKKKYV